MTAAVRLPRWSVDTKPYWDALHQGQLLYRHCNACAEPIFPPRALCPYCLSDKVDWRPSAGTGRVYSFTIQHVAAAPAWKEKVPLALGIIALDEGYHMFAQILADQLDQIEIDRAVTLVFDKVSEELVLPKFRLVAP